MKLNFNQRKGQVFSIDVLFVMLPIMMILGASLQYLYLAEEDTKTLAINTQLETVVQDMSAFVISEMRDNNDPDIRDSADCPDLKTKVDLIAGRIPSNNVYYVYVDSYFDEKRLCATATDVLWSDPGVSSGQWALQIDKESSASELRFALEHDSDGKLKPGKIAGITFTTWKQ